MCKGFWKYLKYNYIFLDINNLSFFREKLKGKHAQLLQSSSIAQETAVTQRELLEQTIKRLRAELSTAKKEEVAMRKDLEGSKNEVYSTSAVLFFCMMGSIVPTTKIISLLCVSISSPYGHQLCLVVTKLEGERSSLTTQLSEAKVGLQYHPTSYNTFT